MWRLTIQCRSRTAPPECGMCWWVAASPAPSPAADNYRRRCLQPPMPAAACSGPPCSPPPAPSCHLQAQRAGIAPQSSTVFQFELQMESDAASESSCMGEAATRRRRQPAWSGRLPCPLATAGRRPAKGCMSRGAAFARRCTHRGCSLPCTLSPPWPLPVPLPLLPSGSVCGGFPGRHSRHPGHQLLHRRHRLHPAARTVGHRGPGAGGTYGTAMVQPGMV